MSHEANMHTVVESSNKLLQYTTGAAATTFLVNAPGKIIGSRIQIRVPKCNSLQTRFLLKFLCKISGIYNSEASMDIQV